MPKEYRTIQEVAGPLMLVRGVENVHFDELGEIELANGEHAAAVYLKLTEVMLWYSFLKAPQVLTSQTARFVS